LIGIALFGRWQRTLLALEHEGRQDALGHQHVVVLLQQILEVLLCDLRRLLIFLLHVLLLIEVQAPLALVATLLLVVRLVGRGCRRIRRPSSRPLHLSLFC
jgi:mannose/fructose/N-acetylgalactosamine-specific phosphotransferase system component IID